MKIDCDRASTLASAALDRRLTVVEFLGVWAHRLVCGPCRAYRRQLLAMRGRARRLANGARPAASMDSAAKDRIRSRLRKTGSPAADD